ncbi:Allene oxide synthase, chloroplastic [Turnera subulata]|uniref:Allene oxide synthase, chloroplastic n=1 Tax=Turnera subulata TaxID=218843 RepID=A0A9Q0GGN4_9ROSI|nr:Allene oxide synthase, chloroplastic [Turnera subulata]
MSSHQPSSQSTASSMQVSPATNSSSTNLPVRSIPGGYGRPFFGPISDRLDYFYKQGRDEFFQSRVEKYKSTVYRANMPPGPFIASDPRVIVLLDGKSFPVLFDVTKVEKKDVFTGTYMPSTKLTGGYRVLSYLDPSEPKHEKLKRVLFYLLKARRDHVIPEFSTSFNELFNGVEKELAKNGSASYNDANDQAVFNFLGRAWFGKNPPDTKLGNNGPKLISLWLLFNIGPILSLGLPKIIEELTFHSFPLPSFLVKGSYQKLYDFFYSSAGVVYEEAERQGISKEEACHNILFATCFNTFGGFKIVFPSLLTHLGSAAGEKFHAQLAQEIRSAVSASNGKITMSAMEQMPLMQSVVYEVLRLEPPVMFQYGKAKRDLVIESHDAAFEVKKGEMLFGYQPFATKDPKIFDRPEEFVADRFVGEGAKLLKHVLWSNGPETESPTVSNKQCAGKDFVVFTTRLFVVELFLRYDTFTAEVGTSVLGSAVSITSLKRAS